MKKSRRPLTKVKNPEPKVGSESWVVWAAWADRITFEDIKSNTGLSVTFVNATLCPVGTNSVYGSDTIVGSSGSVVIGWPIPTSGSENPVGNVVMNTVSSILSPGVYPVPGFSTNTVVNPTLVGGSVTTGYPSPIVSITTAPIVPSSLRTA